MFASHVMYQSAENGSMPLGGDTPFTSRYRRIMRSRESVNSLSSTCMRAPSSISAMARNTSCASSVRLRLSIAVTLLGKLLGGLACKQDGRVSRCNCGVLRRLRQRRQHRVVVEAEEAQKLIGRGQLDDLRERQPGKQIGQFRRQAQTEHADGFVLTQHALRKHDVRQVNLAD